MVTRVMACCIMRPLAVGSIRETLPYGISSLADQVILKAYHLQHVFKRPRTSLRAHGARSLSLMAWGKCSSLFLVPGRALGLCGVRQRASVVIFLMQYLE